MRRFNKLEEAILKMVHKRSKLDNTTGVTWDEYGNPFPLTGETNNTLDKWCHYSGMPSPNAYIKDKDDEQLIIDYNVIDNVIEEESEMDKYNEMRNDDTTGI